MKWNLPFWICLALICARAAEGGEDKASARLRGIVNIPGYKCALAEVPAGIPGHERIFNLQEGQRLGSLEIIKIDPSAGAVEAKVNGTDLEWKLKTAPASGVTGIVLEDVELDSLLPLYAEMADRTVLHAALPKVSVTISFPSTNRASVSSALTNVLKQKGIVAMLDGEKFVIVVPESLVSRVEPRSAKVKSIPATPPAANDGRQNEVIPAGTIDFPAIVLPAVLPIYSELIGAKGVDPGGDPKYMAKTISLHTQNSMSKEEVIYALDTILALEDIKIIRTTNDLIRIEKIQRQ